MTKQQKSIMEKEKPEPRKSIPVPQRAEPELRSSLEELTSARRSFNAYVQGLAAALDVPNGWKLEPESMQFVPPQPHPTD